MAIKLDVLMGNGILAGYHEISKLEAQPTAEYALVTINSYVSEEAYNTSKFIVWQQPVSVPINTVCGEQGMFSGVYTYLTSNSGSPFENGTIVDNTKTDIEKAKLSKIAELKSMCTNTITAGFYSEALGVKHLYPAKILDQSNLVASVLDSLLPGNAAEWSTPFWCMDEDGVWYFRTHTALQIQQAGKDGKASILASISKNEILATQVRSAETLEEINSILWDNVDVPDPKL